MKQSDIKSTDLQDKNGLIGKAVMRLKRQTDSIVKYFQANFEAVFAEAGTAGGTFILTSEFAKGAVNLLNLSPDLEASESANIHGAVAMVIAGGLYGDAVDGLSTKEALLVKMCLVMMELGQLDDVVYPTASSSSVVVASDNSVSLNVSE